jgi:hypothetical protein
MVNALLDPCPDLWISKPGCPAELPVLSAVSLPCVQLFACLHIVASNMSRASRLEGIELSTSVLELPAEPTLSTGLLEGPGAPGRAVTRKPLA